MIIVRSVKRRLLFLVTMAGFLVLWQSPALAGDWPMWGGRPDRNMACPEANLPNGFDPGLPQTGPLAVNGKIKWSVPLGSETYGTPTIAGGKVFIGTNNGAPRDERYRSDAGILLCLDEADGKLLWQLASRPAMLSGQPLGLSSSAIVEGNHLYVIGPAAEAFCLNINGLADASASPCADELKYLSRVAQGKAKPPVHPATTTTAPSPPPSLFSVGPLDANIIWRYDMVAELKVFPHDTAHNSPLIYGDIVFVGTSNGVNSPAERKPASTVPSLIALDQKTGKLLAADDQCIGRRMFHGGWCSPTLGKVNGLDVIFFGGADGVLYAFDARVSQAAPSTQPGIMGIPALKNLWSFDCNPPEYRQRDGQPLKYAAKGDGPCEVIATPVFYSGRVYIAIGQDPQHGLGKGCLWCLDPARLDDQGRPTVIWSDKQIPRSVSTVSIADGLVYIGDRAGNVDCLEVDTGKLIWAQDIKSEIWGSTLVADGKVYVGTKKGVLWILASGRQALVINKIDLHSSICSTPVAANGVLYIATARTLYAIQMDGK